MNYKEIQQKIPTNWYELKLKDYLKLSPVISDSDSEFDIPDPDIITKQILSELDKNIKIISLLSDATVEEVEQLTMVQLDELVNRISFTTTAPVNPKTNIRYKKFNELTYDNWITWTKLSMDFTPDTVLTSAVANLPSMLSMFTKEGLTEEQILELAMPEVIAGFFIVTANIQKYLKRLRGSSYKQVMKIQMTQIKNLLTQYWQKVNPLKRISAKGGRIG